MIELKDRAGKVVVDNTTKLPLLQASKCDLCQDQRSGPACQNACPHQALFRIDTSHSAPLQRWMDKRAA
jgi:Fe-S-cluster-containing hydrogenase component 2